MGRLRLSTTMGSVMAFAYGATSRRSKSPDQLDLFANLSINPAENAPPMASQPEIEDGRENPLASNDSEPLADAPATDGRGTTTEQSIRAGDSRGGVEDGEPAPRIIDKETDAISGRMGDGDTGVGAPADRGPPVTRVLFDLNPTIEVKPSRDFRITEAHRIGQGGLHEKARDNLAAIKTLKQLEVENRDATEDEKAILARYAGWGSLPNAFSYFPPQEWKAIARETQELLTPEEYESARASTPNAHFTSPLVIEGIWDGMNRLGLEPGSQILEPSLGVGHFFGLMPPAVLPGAKRTGVELDSVTARIAQKLYPDATIFAKGFEETTLPNDFFDAVVGNVPFGDYGVHDPAYKRTLTRAIHDYFLPSRSTNCALAA